MPLDRVKLVAVPVQSDSGNAHLVIALQRQVQFWIVGVVPPHSRPADQWLTTAPRGASSSRSTSDDDGVRNLGVNSDAAWKMR